MSKTKSYKNGLTEKLLCSIAQQYHINIDGLEDFVKMAFPSYDHPQDCFNCGASMQSYVFHLDCLDALLVHGMANVIKEKMMKGIPFTEANMVHVQSTLNKYYSVASRTTQCAKLGLIAKVKNPDGTHDREEGWLITSRGWAFLRGEEVPAKIESFRNHIIEHFEERITIDQAFQKHRDLVDRTLKRGKEPKSDYRAAIGSYRASDWFDVGRVVDGKTI